VDNYRACGQVVILNGPIGENCRWSVLVRTAFRGPLRERRGPLKTEVGVRPVDQVSNGPPSGSRRSGLSNSSTLTSLNVMTRTFFTNLAGRYMSHTQASDMRTSK